MKTSDGQSFALPAQTIPAGGFLSLDAATLAYALHGRRATAGTALREGDRVELLRPLVADPKTIRRRRAAAHPLPRPRDKTRHRRA